jgi:opacity protein-like surface antigen
MEFKALKKAFGPLLSTFAISVANASYADGFYLGGSVNYTELQAKQGKLQTNGSFPSIEIPFTNLVGKNDRAVSTGLIAGYQRNLPDTSLYWSVEGFLNFGNGVSIYDSETTTLFSIVGGQQTIARTQTLSLRSSIGARIVFGKHVNSNLSIYGYGGLASVKYNVRDDRTTTRPDLTIIVMPFSSGTTTSTTSTSGSYSDIGITYGIGVNRALNENVVAFAEYGRVNGIDFKSTSLDFETLSVGLKYKF